MNKKELCVKNSIVVAKIIVSSISSQIITEVEKILAEEDLKLQHPDVLFFDEESKLGVEQAKLLRSHLSIKPLTAKGRAVVITCSQNLNHVAQTSLLKTLEEPPENSIILLGANSEDDLLPTVVSRCHIVRLNHAKQEEENQAELTKDIEKLISSSIVERFQFIEKLEKKEELLDALLYFFSERVKKDSDLLEFTKELVQAERWKKANVNIRSILEYLMLRLPASPAQRGDPKTE